MDNVVIIPAYNEGKTIFDVITKTKAFAENIIVVDDGSNDNTLEEAQKSGIKVLHHKVNLGKGAALKTGCEYAVQHRAEKIIVMDADGQHDPREIPLFFDALATYDIVFGIRKVPTTMPFVMRFGNKFISKTLKVMHNIEIEDSQCGYRAFTQEAYQQLQWDALDYFVETEMLIKTGTKKLRYTHLPIETIYADKYKGTTVLDGVRIVFKMIGGKILP